LWADEAGAVASGTSPPASTDVVPHSSLVSGNNPFSLAYYVEIISAAKAAGYRFSTLRDFVADGCPEEGVFILRHDLDARPQTLRQMLDAERASGVRSTIFVRVMANDYNALAYTVLPGLRAAEADGFEIGLHTNFVEYATIAGLDAMHVLATEVTMLRAFLDVVGVSCHRDLNYVHNSLPWLEEHWPDVKAALALQYQAYDRQILDRAVYVNEGVNPHLCWRDKRPEDIVPSGQSICLLTHNHWWYKSHPFEE
jgi:peptidoglycan/xylan/chitin deacetylase (PgdA/CDA1 family)